MTTLETLRSADYLSWLDTHFARTVARIGNESRPALSLAAALVSRAVREGHVCLDLRQLASVQELRNAEGDIVAEQPWPELSAWLEQLHDSRLVGGAQGDTPLVLDARGRLYLRRYWEHEQQLATAIRARAARVDDDLDPAWLLATLDRLFRDNPASPGQIDWQRMAALLAAQRRFCVISGGPGTGKTYTVVKILALLVELAARRGEAVPRMTLVAPTGKAAARLVESIAKAKQTLSVEAAVKDAIPEQAATIHRCLRSIGGSSTLFRHNATNPLVTDLVLVDEASMVDVGLMTRLIEAVPANARLILLGDKDQLASVEAGAVLGDICNTGAPRSYSKPFAAQVETLLGEPLPIASDAPEQTGIWDCIVQLTRSYRYSESSGIGALARAINAGDANTALDLLSSADGTIGRIDPAADWEMSAALRAAVRGGFEPYLQESDTGEQLRLLERFRVLCAHRRGIGGVETLNRQVEETLRDAGLLIPDGATYTGRPLIITQNDYQVRLFNGDVGLVARDPERADGRLVVFPGEQGQLRHLAPSRLPPHDTVFAMSIHKSQGSEFDEVAVVLPQKPSPVLSRELLYTAVTRARQRVTVHAAPEILRAAIERRIERASGLRDLLWGE